MHYDSVWLHFSKWSESMTLLVYGGAAFALSMFLRARLTTLPSSSHEGAVAPPRGGVGHAIAPALLKD